MWLINEIHLDSSAFVNSKMCATEPAAAETRKMPGFTGHLGGLYSYTVL